MQKSEYNQWVFSYSKSTMKTPEQGVYFVHTCLPSWHENIKKHWLCSDVSTANFEKIPHLFLVFHSWIWGSFAGWVYKQKSKCRQVKIMKHERTDANYAILTKRVKLCLDLYLINIFTKSTKVERCTDITFKLTLYYLSVTVEDLNL